MGAVQSRKSLWMTAASEAALHLQIEGTDLGCQSSQTCPIQAQAAATSLAVSVQGKWSATRDYAGSSVSTLGYNLEKHKG